MAECLEMEDGIINLDTDRGDEFGFTSNRFGECSYLFKTTPYIYISFIESRRKGNFRKLAETILALGFGIKVPTPFAEMERILRKEGYRHTIEPFGDGYDDEVEVWVKEAK